MSGTVLLGLISACSHSTAAYGSPEKAVAAACHPAMIRGVYTYRQDSPTQTPVGWQAAGQAVGTGWVALVEKHDDGYRVSNCKWKAIVHG
jgi:hypothetical protein